MRVHLVSHASVVVETPDTRIWSDPWLLGKAFNDSWSLHPAPVYDPALLAEIDFLWISHEHPDHFHIPTLRSLPEAFKQRVVVLFQLNNSSKMVDAFRMLGFPQHRLLPHRQRLRLTPETDVYCYQVGQMDSSLGVLAGDEMVFNVNDSPIMTRDCQRIRRDVGDPDVVLNQFSIAGYGGFEDYETHLTKMAADHLTIMLENHRDLGARTTVPFASFIRFCTEDNTYVNDFANRPRDVHDRFEAAGETAAILFPGDVYEVGEPHDSTAALERFDTAEAELGDAPVEHTEPVPLETIAERFGNLVANLHERYPRVLLRRLKPVTVEIPDLASTIRFSIATGSFETLSTSPDVDLVIRSPALAFAFGNPFGVQTLGVSARYTLRHNFRNWALHRVLFGLYNAEVYLRPRYLFRRENMRYLYSRRRDIADQVMHRMSLMVGGR